MATIKRTRTTRTRNLALESEDTSKELDNKIQSLMKQVYIKNKEQNKIKKEHDAARSELYVLLKDNNIDAYDFLATIEEKKSTLEANVKAPMKSVVDINKLKTLVDQDTFLAIVKASHTDVEKVAGSSVAVQCKVPAAGKENVSVSLKK